MKNLKEYIVEGIFDIDNNIDKVDDTVIPKYWFDLFDDDKNYPKILKDFIKVVRKDGGKKISKNQMDIDSDVCYVSTRSSGKIYISSLKGGNTNYICHSIDFIYSDEIYGKRKWLTAQIECRIFDDNDMFPNDIILRHMSVLNPLMDDFKNIYTLPKKYWGIINKIIENDKHQ